jgi:hypothetical protein
VDNVGGADRRIHLGPALAQADRGHTRLGRILIERGLISEDDLDRALAMQRDSSKRLGQILIENGVLASSDLAKALAENLRVPFVNVESEPDATLTALLPAEISLRLTALPVAQWGTQLVVAMADPNDEQACEEVEATLACPVVIAVADPVALRAVIARVHEKQTAEIVRATAPVEFDCPGCGYRFLFTYEPWVLREVEAGRDPGRLWVWEHDPATSTPVHTCSVLSARRDDQTHSTTLNLRQNPGG